MVALHWGSSFLQWHNNRHLIGSVVGVLFLGQVRNASVGWVCVFGSNCLWRYGERYEEIRWERVVRRVVSMATQLLGHCDWGDIRSRLLTGNYVQIRLIEFNTALFDGYVERSVNDIVRRHGQWMENRTIELWVLHYYVIWMMKLLPKAVKSIGFAGSMQLLSPSRLLGYI